MASDFSLGFANMLATLCDTNVCYFREGVVALCTTVPFCHQGVSARLALKVTSDWGDCIG